MDRSIDTISNLVLLKLYKCSAVNDGMTWSFESVLRAVLINDQSEIKNTVFRRFVDRGWIVADRGFAPYDVEFGILGPDLSGETAIRLTERGQEAALSILKSSEPKTFSQRLHAFNWATWGGIAGVLGLIVTIITLTAS